jgi:hypothetical protein
VTLGLNLESRRLVAMPKNSPPVLLIVVDTEEEFDWSKDFDRHSTSVSAAEHIQRAQTIFEEYGLKPIYVVDFPIASTPASAAVYSELHQSGVAEVGIHLHPWVNPPYAEEVTRYHSYQGNLAPELELAKLTELKNCVVRNMDIEPTIHKAGRYGFGELTAEHLLRLGIDIDLSAAPGYDFSADGGPDYANLDASLYTFGPEDRLFGIPTSGGFMGPLQGLGQFVHRAKMQDSTSGRVIGSLLSKSRMLERVMLSPEGHSLDKMQRMTRSLHQRGMLVTTLSFHSPTVKAGCTPYTSSEADVGKFLDKCKRYVEFFFEELGGVALSPSEIRTRALAPQN